MTSHHDGWLATELSRAWVKGWAEGSQLGNAAAHVVEALVKSLSSTGSPPPSLDSLALAFLGSSDSHMSQSKPW